MKAVLEFLNLNQDQSFHYRKIMKPTFDASYHFHPEYELTYIEKGEGIRYLGNHSERFQAGDLVLIGPNLPHCWVSDSTEEGKPDSIAYVIQFKQDFLGADFFNGPEFVGIRQLLATSKNGIIYNEIENIKETMAIMESATPINRIQSLLSILVQLSQIENYKIANSYLINSKLNNSGVARFQKVFSHIILNYAKQIDLDEVAEIANLSRTSFCRYFKGVSNKTYIEVIFEFRLEKACYLLSSTGLSIQQICFDCGFNDIPFFNKLFKKKFEMAPNAYRKLFTTV
jgi:AraC-like DNA-binding protein